MNFIRAFWTSQQKAVKQWVYTELLFIFIMVLFYFLCGPKLQYKEISHAQEEITDSVGELTENNIIQQTILSDFDELTEVEFLFADYGKTPNGLLDIILTNESDHIVYPSIAIDTATVREGEWYKVPLPFTMDHLMGKTIRIKLFGHSDPGEAPTLFYSSHAVGDFIAGGQTISGQLCLRVTARTLLAIGQYYVYIVLAGVLVLTIVLAHVEYCRKHEKKNIILMLELVWTRYHFLIEQLISRDFKTKYKRSVLGYLWSFLNPLLTSLVQYMVFSTIFKSDIDNFPIYLLTGTLFFGFFSEAVNQGLSAIVCNAALITKVYVPKWIYPVTKVCASATNFIISLLPLFVVALFTGCRLTPAILLLVFDVCCLLLFCIGLSMALSACNVFFRDTQYLWSIATMVWMYSTPLFYPETILPETFRSLLQFNPLYHYVKFARVCIIDGVSPELSTYAFCLVSAFISLMIGCSIFKKTQNRFALYI